MTFPASPAETTQEGDAFVRALDEAVTAICAATGWPYGQAWRTGDGGSLSVTAGWFPGDESFASLRHASASFRLEPGTGLPGIALHSVQPVVIRHVTGDPRFLRQREAAESGLDAAVLVPVQVHGQLVAVLEFFLTHAADADDRTLPLVAQIARQLAWQHELARLSELSQRDQRHLDAIERLAHLGRWRWTAATDELELSEPCARIFGVEPGQKVTRRQILGRVVPEDQPRVAEAVARALEQGTGYELEYRFAWPDGQIRHARGHAQVERDGAGAVRGLLGTVQDVTDLRERQANLLQSHEDLARTVADRTAGLQAEAAERRRAEASLVQSEQRFRVAFEAAPDGMAIATVQGQLLQVNRALCQFLGYDAAELDGRSWADFAAADEVEGLRAAFAQQLHGTGMARVDRRYRRKDGALVWGRSVLSLVRDAHGKPEYCIAQVQDIHDFMRIQASRDRLIEILESTPDLVATTDAYGNALYLNRAGRQLLGLGEAKEITDHTFRDAHPPAEIRRIQEEIVPAAVRDGAWSGDVTYLTRTGTLIETSLVLIAHRRADGRVRFFSIVARDIREQRRRESEIRALNRHLERHAAELQAANRELEAFSYSVSHDLRAPLRAIDGFSALLDEQFQDGLPDDARRYLALVRENAAQMNRLIDDLLQFSRLSRKPLERTEVDLTALAHEALRDLQPLPTDRRVVVEIQALPTAQGDAALLRQVLVNLLANAVKFTRIRPEAHVTVGSAQVDGQTAWFVRDDGVGFDMRYAPRLFGVFQRLHRADEYEGTGVGLAIVQRIVARHGGRVWAEGTPGQGATFWFTLG